MRVALVHDYLNQRGGAERVFAHIANAFPDAPIFTALFDRESVGDLIDASRVHTSWLARIPGANRRFRYFAPLYPRVFEGFDFRAYDLIVSSTSSWAKGIRFAPPAKHLCYTHTVSRFVFDYERYLGGFGMATLARPMVARLARWDYRAAQRPTQLLASSQNAAERIRTYYHRDVDVLYPPVDLDLFAPADCVGEYFFIASRLLGYKRLDLAIAAADEAGAPLRIAGTGPDEARLRELARGTTTTLLGYVSDRERASLMAQARAVLLPGEEDFGLTPIEAAASGRPAIALRAGGARETIVENVTGAFFDEPTSHALATVLRTFRAEEYVRSDMLAHAGAFSPAAFTQRLRARVDALGRQ